MKISESKVVCIDYTLKNDAGEVLDTSEGREPLAYLHGHGNIIPGLENALLEKEVGTSMDVSVEAKDAYGERSDERLHEVNKSEFGNVDDISPGVQIRVEAEGGGVQIATISKVEDDKVTLDFNHPLAGERLHFSVEVKEIREATKEELDHGHVHGPGGHHH